MASRRRQSQLDVGPALDAISLLVGPSEFLSGQVPARFQPDPRATAAWKRVRRQALRRDRGRCLVCGAAADDVDHRVELIDGGAAYDLANLQSLCGKCHDAKSSEARYQRSVRAGATWGRMSVCPRCRGSGRCALCDEPAHGCTFCLGVRVVPERVGDGGDVPSQFVLALVGSSAWEGAVRPGPAPDV